MFYVPENQPNYSQDFINLIHSIKHMNQHKNKCNSAKIYYFKHFRTIREQQTSKQLTKIKIKKIHQKLIDIKKQNTFPIIQKTNNRILGIKGAPIPDYDFSHRNRYNNSVTTSQQKRIRFKSEDCCDRTSELRNRANKSHNKNVKSEISQQQQKLVHLIKEKKNLKKDSKNESQKITPWMFSNTKLDYYSP